MKTKIKTILNKVGDVLSVIYGYGIMLSLFIGGLSFVGYLVALIIGGHVAATICTVIYRDVYSYLVYSTSLLVLLGLLIMYLKGETALSATKKKPKKVEKKIKKNSDLNIDTNCKFDKKRDGCVALELNDENASKNKKALVLCGGIPQIALIKYLKSEGVFTILADKNEKVPGRVYADKFYPISVLDIDAVRDLAIREKVDFLITVCADQVLQVVAQISQELNLPCYIDFETAENVSKKSYMKQKFIENGITTSKYVILNVLSEDAIRGLNFPLIVKPVDAYSSRGVQRVNTFEELKGAFITAVEISRSHYAVVEEFVEGEELSVDVYVEDGIAHVLSVSHLDKIGEDGKFVIHRGRCPAQISKAVQDKITNAAQAIAQSFGLKNSPMLIQLISRDENISVVEFCARTGGGVKFRLIEKISGFDVVKAVADLTLGRKPHYEQKTCSSKYINNEFLYCSSGTFDHMEGLEELLQEDVITEYYLLKSKGHIFKNICSSGDRVACYTIEAESLEDMNLKRLRANELVKAISKEGVDILRHDLILKNI